MKIAYITSAFGFDQSFRKQVISKFNEIYSGPRKQTGS